MPVRNSRPPAPRKPAPGVAVEHSVRLLNRMSMQVRRTLRTPDIDAVHDLRVSIRRLMASLDLFDSGLGEYGGRKIRKRIKKLLDLAGAVRDCDVAVKHAEKFSPDAADTAQLLVALQERRAQAIEPLLAGLNDRIGRKSIVKWRAKLRAAPGNGEVEKAARDILDGMFAEFMTRGRNAAKPHASGGQLHYFRLAAKSLHYALELPIAPEHAAAWMAGAKAVQKLVGEIHDCEAVRALTKEMPGSAGLTKVLRQRQAKKRAQYRDLWNEHLATSPGPQSATPPISAEAVPEAKGRSRSRVPPSAARPQRPAEAS